MGRRQGKKKGRRAGSRRGTSKSRKRGGFDGLKKGGGHGRKPGAGRRADQDIEVPSDLRALLGLVRRNPGVTTQQLAQGIATASEARQAEAEIDTKLLRAERLGFVVRPPRSGWFPTERSDYRVGRLGFERSGTTQVRVDRRRGPICALVDTWQRQDAVAGDIVLVKLVQKSRTGRPGNGKIVRVLERRKKPVEGTVHLVQDGAVVRPKERGIAEQLFVPDPPSDLESGESILVRVLPGSRNDEAHAEVISRRIGSLEADLLTISEEFDLPGEHTPEVDAEAESFEVRPDGAEWPDREDQRSLVTFTIDPKDARDFDDAVSIEPLRGGGCRLGVHIADVAHYVKPDSLIDQAAIDRGTSVYLPGRVIRMLPERLADNLCSLR
ncbi:MAG: RNB domain-containing ribonuclease, partial [Planctomycetota bacterium]